MTYYYGGLAVGITAFAVLILRICCRAWSPKTRRHQPTRAQLRGCQRRSQSGGRARIVIYVSPYADDDNDVETSSSLPRLPTYSDSQALEAQMAALSSQTPPTLASLAELTPTSGQDTESCIDGDLAPPPYEEVFAEGGDNPDTNNLSQPLLA